MMSKTKLILVLAVYLRVVTSHSLLPRCQKITTPICQQLGYNTTLMPNFMGHTDQREAALGLQAFGGLLRHNCSSFLRLFVCSVFIPLCSEDVPAAVPACRGLCDEVRKDCLSALHNVGLSWPAELNCSRFPEPPYLCMQQPSEEDMKEVTRGERLHNLKSTTFVCPPNTLPGYNERCLKKCNNDDKFNQSDKSFYAVWTIVLSVICLIITLFSLLTFLTQPKRFRWPARPVLYLCVCGFLKAIVYLLRWIVGPLICTGSTIIEKPTDSLSCTSLALLLVYTDVVMSLWWCVFSFIWYLSAAREWSTEAIEKLSPRLHTFVWSVATIPLIITLISTNIELNELTGLCQIFNYILIAFQLFFISLGCILAVFTSFALRNVRRALVYESRCPYKLERLILRLGIISLGICVGLVFSIICEFFIHSLYAVLLKVFMQFLSAIFASLWVFSSKTFKSWNKILKPTARNKGCLPVTKI